MPPPQCPECGRFLATAFVEQISAAPAPCPGCGTELSLGDEDEATASDAVTPDEAPPVPPPAATLPSEGAAGADDALDDAEPDDADVETDSDDAGEAPSDAPVQLGETSEPATTEAPAGEEPAGEEPSGAGDAPAVPPPAATLPDDVEPEPETSVRPPDLPADRDPLAGWDESPTIAVAHEEPDPAIVAAGAGAGLLVGLLLGGRDHRGLGALLGAALGAVLAQLRG